MPTVNEKLADEAIAHAINLHQYSVGVARRMIATLNRSDARIMVDLAVALEQMDPESFTVQRLEALLGSVRALNAEIYRQVFTDLDIELQQFTEFETGYQYDLFKGIIPEPVQVRFPLAPVAPSQAYAASMSRPFQGRLLRDWASVVEADRMTLMRNAVRQGFVEGKTASQIVRDIRGTRANNYADGFLQRPRRELMTVVQTAVSHTAATAREQFQAANSNIIKAVQWVSTLDSKTSPQCFPESTFALPVGDLRGIFRRKWDGDLVVVTTASGKKLSATPNHPVLTARGWRPIEKIEPCNDVLYRIGRDVGGISAAEDIEMPATMRAVFDSLSEPTLGNISSESSTEVDFHGDGMSGDYKVHYAYTKGNLWSALKSLLGDEAAEKFLVFIAGSAFFSELGEMDKLDLSSGLINMASEFNSGSIENRIKAGFADIIFSKNFSGLKSGSKFSNNSPLIHSSHMLAATERGHYTGTLENTGNGCGGDSKFAPDGGCGLSIGVVADDVVSVERKFFSGHVCNLSTDTGLYIADSFIVHNCRIRDHLKYDAQTHKPIGHKAPWLQGPGRLHFGCRSTDKPVTKSWRELGIPVDEMTPAQRASMDGQVPAETSYPDWIKRQSAGRQDQILGPERGRLMRQGGLELPDFYDNKGNWLTIDQLKERERAAFLALAA